MKLSGLVSSFVVAASIIGLYTAFRGTIDALDSILLRQVSGLHVQALDSLLAVILGSQFTLVVLQEDPVGATAFWLLVAAVVGYRRGWKWFLLSLLTLFLSQFVAYFLKFSIARPRPPEEAALSLRVQGLDNDPSFPSGHAQKSFAMATVLGRAWPNTRRLWYVVALMVAFERLYVGAHFPSDILSGIADGIAIGLAVLHPAIYGRIEAIELWLSNHVSKV